jgi:hypothetical protein
MTFVVNKRNFAVNPIVQDLGKWYYWQGTWASRGGPYSTEEEATEALEKYCVALDKEYREYEEVTKESSHGDIK